MRAILASILAFVAFASQAEWKQPRVVDLNKPGALDRVAAESPAHHRLLLDMMRAIAERSCDEALKLYRARHDAALNCSAYMLMTSFPAKRLMSVQIEGVRYIANVAVDVPARHIPVE